MDWGAFVIPIAVPLVLAWMASRSSAEAAKRQTNDALVFRDMMSSTATARGVGILAAVCTIGFAMYRLPWWALLSCGLFAILCFLVRPKDIVLHGDYLEGFTWYGKKNRIGYSDVASVEIDPVHGATCVNSKSGLVIAHQFHADMAGFREELARRLPSELTQSESFLGQIGSKAKNADGSFEFSGKHKTIFVLGPLGFGALGVANLIEEFSWIGVGILGFALALPFSYPYRIRLSANGLSGRDYLGRRVNIVWPEVSHIKEEHPPGATIVYGSQGRKIKHHDHEDALRFRRELRRHLPAHLFTD